MSGITFRHKGDFSKTEKFFNSLLKLDYLNVLERYGQAGVAALVAATPKDSGLTAASWDYEITHNGKETTIAFTNSNVSNGVNIAIILQYGHGTKGGGYVAGRDYINPAIQPIFDKMANEAWREVTNL
ncbi:HK97 gp10 family phage protein [Lachnospiraceae bacterium]|nr:HK97 gp10 family phage protein [Lachnospiraceae bacterium]